MRGNTYISMNFHYFLIILHIHNSSYPAVSGERNAETLAQTL